MFPCPSLTASPLRTVLDEALEQDGPLPGCSFRWKGQKFNLGNKLWALVDIAWQSDGPIPLERLQVEVWGASPNPATFKAAVSRGAIDTAVSRANHKFMVMGCPRRLRVRGGHLELTDV
jgi:hypothetical protein